MLDKYLNKYKSLSVQVKASFWFLIASVMQKGISVISTPIFTRLMKSAEYGNYNVFNSWLSIMTVFITLNLCGGVYTMGIVKFREDEKVFTSSLQGLTLILCALWGCLYMAFRKTINALLNLSSVQMLAMLLMIWATAAFSFWMTTQRNQYKYVALIVVTLIVSFLKPLVGIICVINSEDKVTARILGLMLVETICYTPFFFIQMNKGKTFFSAKYWKYAVLFNIPLIPHYLSGTILNSSDRIMIQRMVGESQAGLYSLAYNVALLMTMVNDALNKTMSPWLYQKIREKEYGRMHTVVYPSLVCVGICNLILIAIAPELVSIFAPPEYMDAIFVIVPVALSGFFSYLYLCFAPFEFYFEKRIWTTIGTFISALTNVVLNLIFISLYGYIAAGYTTLICSMINALLHMHFMTKVCNTYLNGIKPYNSQKLVIMSLFFVVVGLTFIPMYKVQTVRYGVLSITIASGIVFRNRVISFFKTISDK